MNYTQQNNPLRLDGIPGLGPRRLIALDKEAGVKSLRDLLYFFPYKYVDKSKDYKICDIKTSPNGYVSIKGHIVSTKVIRSGQRSRLMAVFSDGYDTAQLVWFKGISFIKDIIKPGSDIKIFGKHDFFNGNLSFVHPEIDLSSSSGSDYGIHPVYSLNERLLKTGVNNRLISKVIRSILDSDTFSLEETLPDYALKSFGLEGRMDALKNIHFPSSIERAKRSLRRFKFEELFYLNLDLLIQKRKSKLEKSKGITINDISLLHDFYGKYLPFELTSSQKKVIREIYNDLKTGFQVNRLIQGDVGSGKTIVAFITCLMAISSGLQVAYMAPTEVLAEQIFSSLSSFFYSLGLRCGLLTGSVTNAERKVIFEDLASGNIDCLFGTHAIIEDKVTFSNLGMVIIDEQHKFGVIQRAKLWSKSKDRRPHIIVMTATPIPRTLALTLYGNLDVSKIDELPQGRQPIKTHWYRDSSRLRVFGFVHKEINNGRQVYFVYPLIEESENFDYKDLNDGYESISRAFPDAKIGVLHGKMRPEDKEFEMKRFLSGETDILVSTTVVEVGINVPNATVMVIENAERFGLAQLHQLRGRVGRGIHQSYCMLMTGHKVTEVGRKRLEIMTSTNDGFEIANEDLKLRGPGDISGLKQSGLLNLKVADIVKDQELLEKTRMLCVKILSDDPNFDKDHNIVIREQLKKKEFQNIDLSSVG